MISYKLDLGQTQAVLNTPKIIVMDGLTQWATSSWFAMFIIISAFFLTGLMLGELIILIFNLKIWKK